MNALEVGVDESMRTVAVGKFGNCQRPVDSEPWIGDVECAFGLGVERGTVQINEFAIFNQCLKTVSEAFRNHQAALVIGGKNFTVPLQESGRTLAQVDGNIEDLSFEAVHKFAFGMRRALEMQPTHGALLAREGVVDLGNGFVPADLVELFGTKETDKETTWIGDGLGLNAHEARQRRGVKDEAGHAYCSTN